MNSNIADWRRLRLPLPPHYDSDDDEDDVDYDGDGDDGYYAGVADDYSDDDSCHTDLHSSDKIEVTVSSYST